jgi:hypothetical protein
LADVLRGINSSLKKKKKIKNFRKKNKIKEFKKKKKLVTGRGEWEKKEEKREEKGEIERRGKKDWECSSSPQSGLTWASVEREDFSGDEENFVRRGEGKEGSLLGELE